MPIIMRSSSKHNDEVLDAERLRQIARRKEQNRNAQRRLRERKEEYTMQLEAQLTDLHRRAQSQEEESQFLREALARMRADNMKLVEQISLIHRAVPSTQTTHPLPQRASVDLGVDLFAPNAPLDRGRNRSQSVTATAMQNLGLGPAPAPWSLTSSQHPLHATHPVFASTIAPGSTHRIPLASNTSMAGAPPFASGLALPSMADLADDSMPRSEDASRRSSFSPLSHRRSSTLLSPFDVRGNLSRHGSDLTELTVPSEHSDSENGGSSRKIQRAIHASNVVRASTAPSPSALASAAIASSEGTAGAAAGSDKLDDGTSSAAPGSDVVMASCLDSIHSMPFGTLEESKPSAAEPTPSKMQYDGGGSWMSTASEAPGQLALSDLRHTDMSGLSKPMGITPSALGLSNVSAMGGSGASSDGWTISPWINMSQTPSAAGAGVDPESGAARLHGDGQRLGAGMAFGDRQSLAARRGFSGSLKLETPTL